VKVTLYDWACESDTVLERLGYKHGQEIPADDLWKVAQELFDGGLNVMIHRSRHNDSVTLYVDTHRFTQR